MNDDNPVGKQILLSIGSNLGNRKEAILQAVELIKIDERVKITKISGFYETEPVGVTDQGWFLNICAVGISSFEPSELLPFIKSVEYLIGRRHRMRWHEREIDIDLILSGNDVIDEDMVKIPHPMMQERRFVLVPAAEIAPEMIHPVFGITVNDLLKRCNDNSVVKPYLK